MKHILRLAELNASGAGFTGEHQHIPFPPGGRRPGTEPFGPFRVTLQAGMSREDWEAAGRPLDVEVDL